MTQKYDFKKEGVPFTQVSNILLNDSRISAKTKGVYAYLYSKPDDWDFALDRIAQAFSDGRKGIYSALKELEHYGYLKRSKQPSGRTLYSLAISPESQLSPKGNRDKKPVVPEGNLPLRHVAPKGSISNTDNILIKNINNKEVPNSLKSNGVTFDEAQEIDLTKNMWWPGKDKAPETIMDSKEDLFGTGEPQPRSNRKQYGIDYLRTLSKLDVLEFAGTYECSEQDVINCRDRIILYIESNGRRYKNHRAVLQKWLLEEKIRRNSAAQNIINNKALAPTEI